MADGEENKRANEWLEELEALAKELRPSEPELKEAASLSRPSTTDSTSWQQHFGPMGMKPYGGTPVAEIKVRNGNMGQVENVLKEFQLSSNSVCYLSRFEPGFPFQPKNEPDYWIINLFVGDEAIYKGLRQNMADRRNTELWLKTHDHLKKQTLDIGYVEVSNFPIVPIIFYVALEQMIYVDRVRLLAEEVKVRMGELGFEIVRQERVAASTETGTEKTGHGRPSDKDYDWAYEQIYFHKRPRHQVYREWLERIGNKAKTLDNPKDSFNSAIKARKRAREKKGKKD